MANEPTVEISSETRDKCGTIDSVGSTGSIGSFDSEKRKQSNAQKLKDGVGSLASGVVG